MRSSLVTLRPEHLVQVEGTLFVLFFLVCLGNRFRRLKQVEQNEFDTVRHVIKARGSPDCEFFRVYFRLLPLEKRGFLGNSDLPFQELSVPVRLRLSKRLNLRLFPPTMVIPAGRFVLIR